MIDKLNQRDNRALKLGGICIIAIIVLAFGMKWFDHWHQVRKSLVQACDKLDFVSPPETKQEKLRTIVPVFEMPKKLEDQKFLFRDRLNEQLKKAGIKSKPLEVLGIVKSVDAPEYKLLRLRYSGRASFSQVLDLLASLNENPYLVGIEEFSIKCDPKKKQEVDLNLTVSTFIK